MQSLTSATPSLVIIPQTLPMPSITKEPESPCEENKLGFKFLGSMHTSFDTLPGWPSFKYVLTKAQMVFRRPMVRLDALLFFMTITLSWSKLVSLNIDTDENISPVENPIFAILAEIHL